jgi:hypothetical protein
LIAKAYGSDSSERRRPDLNRGWRICNRIATPEKQGENQDFQESAQNAHKTAAFDGELQTLINAWPTLSPGVKTRVLALVNGAEI